MKQQLNTIYRTKFSDILRQAHEKGVKKITGAYMDNQGGYCALGVMMEFGGYGKGKPATYSFVNDLSKSLFGRNFDELNNTEVNELYRITTDITRINDLGYTTFLDCAEYLDKCLNSNY